MDIKFIGVPGEKHESLSMYGYEFPLNKFVAVSGSFAIGKLKNHPHFEAKPVEAEDVEVKDVSKKPETLADFLEQTVAEIVPALPKLSDSQLSAILEAETAGKARKGVVDAVVAEQAARAPKD